MPTARIYRFEIPVDHDDTTVTVHTTGEIIAWGCRHNHTVEGWMWADRPGDTPAARRFSVHGTGHPIGWPAPGAGVITHRASLTTPGGQFVWHVLEHTASDAVPVPVDPR